MTKKIIEYGFMADDQGITYIINHKPPVLNNKYKFYKVIENTETEKIEPKKLEPKKIENKFIKKPEVSEVPEKTLTKSNLQTVKKITEKNEISKNNDIKITSSNDNLQNIETINKERLFYGIPFVIILFLLIIYFIIPSSKTQYFGKKYI